MDLNGEIVKMSFNRETLQKNGQGDKEMFLYSLPKVDLGLCTWACIQENIRSQVKLIDCYPPK